jgi:eukaryotic-like serine/threonine-protein kinase
MATASVPEPTSEPTSHVLAAGSRLGAYELLVPIASGGMGHVWAAVRLGDFGFRRMVALKVMREGFAESGSFRRMFLDEARIASRILHSNVVEVLDLGEARGTLYQVMAFVNGDSLSHLLKVHKERHGAPIGPEIAARITLDVLRGLHAAHELTLENGRPSQLVHRDVSPQNVLVGLDGVAKITDFGIAKAMGESHLLETEGGAKGKLAYMAPEQMQGGAVDRRCDVFATGLMLWEMLSGTRLTHPAATLLAGEPLPPPTTKNPSAHAGLAEIAMRAISKDPAARYQTAAAMADAIEKSINASGLGSTTTMVASWTGDLVSATVNQRLTQVEDRLAKTEVGVVQTQLMPTNTPQWVPPSAGINDKPKRNVVWMIAMGVMTVMSVAFLAWAALHSSNAPAPATQSVIASNPPIFQPPATSAPVVSATPLAVSAASVAPPSTSVTASAHVRKPVVPASTLKPKFGNPYGN